MKNILFQFILFILVVCNYLLITDIVLEFIIVTVLIIINAILTLFCINNLKHFLLNLFLCCILLLGSASYCIIQINYKHNKHMMNIYNSLNY